MLAVAADAASSQVDPNKAAECILGCLLWCSRPPPPAAGSTSPAPPPLAAPQAAPVVQHLLIEALPQGTGLSDNRQLATELMLLYCSSGGSKLASKVSDTAWVWYKTSTKLQAFTYICAPHTRQLSSAGIQIFTLPLLNGVLTVAHTTVHLNTRSALHRYRAHQSPSCNLQVASSFHLTREDLGSDGWQQLSAALPLMLQQPTSYKPAVYLMMQFEVRHTQPGTSFVHSMCAAVALGCCSTASQPPKSPTASAKRVQTPCHPTYCWHTTGRPSCLNLSAPPA